jgi:hypothetical protein
MSTHSEKQTDLWPLILILLVFLAIASLFGNCGNYVYMAVEGMVITGWLLLFAGGLVVTYWLSHGIWTIYRGSKQYQHPKKTHHPRSPTTLSSRLWSKKAIGGTGFSVTVGGVCLWIGYQLVALMDLTCAAGVTLPL